jgi:hypothetical protein
MDEGRDSVVDQSAPSANNSAAPAAGLRWNLFYEGWRKCGGVCCVQSEPNAGFRRFADVSRGNNPWRNLILRNFTHKLAWQTYQAKVLFQTGMPDTLSSTTIRSQSTLWIHQLKLFLTGWNVALCASTASDVAAAGFLPPLRTRPRSPNTVLNSVKDRAACPTVSRQCF